MSFRRTLTIQRVRTSASLRSLGSKVLLLHLTLRLFRRSRDHGRDRL